MSQLTDLVSFMKQHLPKELFIGQKFDSFMNNVELERTVKKITEDQYQIAIMSYDAVLSFDAFPFSKVPPDLVFVLVNVFLEQAKEQFEREFVENPSLDIEIIDDDTADIIISIKLIDKLTIVADKDGEIPFLNRRFKIAEPIIHRASAINITAEVL